MDAIEAITTRVTVPPAKMGEPGPNDAELATMVRAAAAAPDHGRLVPFRFLVVRGTARERLGVLFAGAGRGEAEAAKLAEGPARAPVLVLAVARLRPDHPKIPVEEQRAAAAAAVQNLLLAAHALGFAAKWATGRPAADPKVAAGLGLDADERLLAIVYLGTAIAAQPPPERPAPADLMRAWTG